ncbi:phage major capsid protein [Hymenobacter sp. HSC-4F20]|uniref:phage major capsid protein n=1 Tax=Hymenobacter sp. HSC-4F20 TaxID=2864135 RepID=UPI001C731EA9|nr:phage major capsid protein [Hymenobacter sp. HSC-4F20]MBX0290117.1 phage major capsid protein [Hymenobacter sp. HSC-4F20]
METEVIDKIAKEVKGDFQKVETKATEIAAEVKSLSELNAKLQAQVDALEAKSNRAGRGGEFESKNAFELAVEAKAAELKNRGAGEKVEIKLDRKAAVDMFSSVGEAFKTPLKLGYQAEPTIPTSMSDIVNGGSINTDVVNYFRISGYEGGPQMVAEGAKKPNFSLTTEPISATVKKIAVTAKFTEEATRDASQLVSLVKSEMIRLHDEFLSEQQLLGSGTGNDLQGILPLAKPFNAGYFAGTIENAQKIDALRVAIAQARIALFTPTHIVMNPNDVAELEMVKLEDGGYMLPTIFTGQLPSIGRVRIVEMDAMPAGQFLVGAFDRAAQLYTRDGLSIRVYDQNEDDALHNMVLVVLESRHVQLVKRPESFIKGSFATAIPAINKAVQ